MAAAKAGGVPAAPAPPPAVFGRLPWDEMRDEIQPQVLVTLAFLARLLHRAARDEIRVQLATVIRDFPRLPAKDEKDEIGIPPPAG